MSLISTMTMAELKLIEDNRKPSLSAGSLADTISLLISVDNLKPKMTKRGLRRDLPNDGLRMKIRRAGVWPMIERRLKGHSLERGRDGWKI